MLDGLQVNAGLYLPIFLLKIHISTLFKPFSGSMVKISKQIGATFFQDSSANLRIFTVPKKTQQTTAQV